MGGISSLVFFDLFQVNCWVVVLSKTLDFDVGDRVNAPLLGHGEDSELDELAIVKELKLRTDAVSQRGRYTQLIEPHRANCSDITHLLYAYIVIGAHVEGRVISGHLDMPRANSLVQIPGPSQKI